MNNTLIERKELWNNIFFSFYPRELKTNNIKSFFKYKLKVSKLINEKKYYFHNVKELLV